ncbi:MAG: winged helix-turn-helix domain-containing protein [Acidilobaceae archaeon]|nr:winged helix-turn-helix domain-containing protein [Acidilobaceae archaeon]MCX8165862.1 winged helix-turn-helix domain-containing protein [Acidilobaceae archaeon]MDW7974870.1 winged helix-turn-helix domain-containing protein [Sulfolobales archaeon]
MELEEICAGKGRVKVLKLLLKEGHATVTRLARETGLNHARLLEHLRALEKMGLVEERRYGRIRLYEIKYKDPRVGALKEAFEVLERL